MTDEENKETFPELNIDGIKYTTRFTKKFSERKPYKPENLNLVKAFIPGTIVKLYVRRNRKVDVGDDLLILEAMKMQNLIKAPVAGKIKKIHVKKGQMVSKNFVMIEIQ